MDALEEVGDAGLAGDGAGALDGGLEGEAHLDVGGGELLTGEPRALGEFGLEVVHVVVDLRLDEAGLGLGGEPLGDGPGEERHRGALEAVEDQLEQQGRHRGALGVMHPVAVAQRVGGAVGGFEAAVAMALDEVLEDGAGFGDHQALVADDRGLAERVHGAQLGRGQHGLGVALVMLDLVGEPELLKQPQDPLRAGVVEVVDGEHRRSLCGVRDGTGAAGDENDHMNTPTRPFEPQYYAVIFCSQRTEATPGDGYGEMAERMVALAAAQPGYLGVESARGADGLGITVSYWRSLEDIRAWRAVSEHQAARDQGRRDWYRHYELRIAKVERHYSWDEADGTGDPVPVGER